MNTDPTPRQTCSVRRGRYSARDVVGAAVAAAADVHALAFGEILRVPDSGAIVVVATQPTLAVAAPGIWTAVASVRPASAFEAVIFAQVEALELSLAARRVAKQ